MKKIQFTELLLAISVIASFLGSAVAIGYRNYGVAFLLILVGFFIMFIGLKRKKRIS